MKIKNLRYRSPSASFMVAILLVTCGSLLSVLFGVMYFAIWLAESVFNITASPLFLQFLVLSALILCQGIWGCIIYSNHRKLAKAIMSKSEAVTVQQVSEELMSSPSGVLTNLNRTLNNRYWSGYGITDSSFALVDGAKNLRTVLANPNFTFRETTQYSRACLGFFAVVWLLYAIDPGFGSWKDYAMAGSLSILALLISAAVLPKKIAVSQQAVKAQEYRQEAVKTGVEEADDLLREGFFHLGYLTDLDKTIGNEKLSGTIRELLNITKQIFDYVKKQPEKAKQIRQFIRYYLPTTVKLLRNYEELNNQPVRGDNIKESMQKIEGIMDGILLTFRQHLDDLYRDKSIDISAEIAVMENMLNQKDTLFANR
ncbi:MAG: 5-bromo-4-chloroindolyl phosphate hydrolysis family protein [Betaproteobacteria bacterium]|nr:5-bromo-4-chloroindolyl phosphate hydrolysis family protein [Betaproteobacteria bacterium]